MKKRMNRFLAVVLSAGVLLFQGAFAVFAAEPSVGAEGELTYTSSYSGQLIAPNGGGAAGPVINLGRNDGNDNNNRMGILQFDTNEYVGEYPVKEFTFDDGTMQECVTNANVTGEVSEGVLTLKEYKTADVRVETPDNLNLDASKCQKVVVRLKNNTNVSELRLYFAIKDGSNYDGRKTLITVPITSGDTEFKEYVFDVAANGNWSGFVRRLRFDCAIGYEEQEGLANTMEIDSIRFIGGKPTSKLDLVNNEYDVKLRIHTANTGYVAQRTVGVYGLPVGIKELVPGSMNWNTAQSIVNYTDNCIVDDEFEQNAWNEFDVTEYAAEQTDGVFTFKIAMTGLTALGIEKDDDGRAGGFCYTQSNNQFWPELIFTQTSTGKAGAFRLQGVTSDSESDTLAAGATISKINVKKNTDHTGSVTMLLAVYDKQTNALVGVYPEDITDEAAAAQVGDTMEIATNYQLPDNANMKGVVYFWNGFNQMHPIATAQPVQ